MKTNKLLSIILIIISFFAGAAGMYALVNYGPKSVQTVINRSEKEVTVVETGIADAVEKIYDAVVVVGSYKNGQLVGTGTGFVYDQDNKYAYILTNSHVVNGSTSVKVKFTNDNIENVELIGNDINSDIAVLKIDKEKIIKVAEIGDSSSIRVGDTTFAIGSPIGDEYTWTVTRGILSGKDRFITIDSSDIVMKLLQTDTAINSGNSGGPLSNSNGEVIGITNMKLVNKSNKNYYFDNSDESNSIESMGFAIPINDAIKYAAEIREKGKIEGAFLGITSIDTLDSNILSKYNIKIDSNLRGVVIIETQKSSPADKANLKKGDVIVKIEDYDIKSFEDLQYYLYNCDPGDKVTLTYVREGTTKTTEVELGKSE